MWIKVIKNGQRKDGSIGWSLVAVEWLEGKEKARRVDKSQYQNFGFDPALPYALAKDRAAQVQAKDRVEKRQSKRLDITTRLETQRIETLAFLPQSDIALFESQILAMKYLSTNVLDPKEKVTIRWRAALRLMSDVKLDPPDWYDHFFIFHHALAGRKFSVDYCNRLIGLLNEYGFWFCKRYKKAFLPIPKLKGKARKVQILANNKKPNAKKKSDPVTPEQLESARSKLKLEHYNWLKIAIWFGPRPEEIDNLKKGEGDHTYRLSIRGKHTVLSIFQPKLLLQVEEAKCWKHIPLLYPEQIEALKIIQSGKFERPSLKRLRSAFTPKTGVYCGRKNFVSLMTGKGHEFATASMWLGHKKLDRTLADYTDANQVHGIPMH